MIELAKHIEILLLDNDCVTVPELGGFIAHYQSVRYVEEEGLFLPPTRTVGFNPQLIMNDGLLAQSYMQAYHTDFPDATRRIQMAVNELKEVLYTDGVADLHGIGVINYNIHGNFEFQPAEGGILSPSIYGLGSFSMAPLGAEAVDVAPVQEPLPVVESQPKEIRMVPRWVGHVAAAVIAVILFFTFSVPVENTYVDQGNYASLGTACLFDDIRSHSMATTLSSLATEAEKAADQQIKPVKVKVEKVPAVKVEPTPAVKVSAPEAKAEVKVEAKAETKVEAPVAVKAEPMKETQVQGKKKYHLIVSSLATMADAQKMLRKYADQGYTDATVVEGSGRFRIALYSYSDRTAAQQKIAELKQNDAFKDAWMLTSK